MINRKNSIFREYYSEKELADRFIFEIEKGVDVIVPVIHTNELWYTNLLSFYREIPIHNLLIGDGGCIDDSIEIASRFPRVRVLDHRNFKSLGYSIRKLIEAVTTEWFVYLHSDVFLPPKWFDEMEKHRFEYDWFGCPMRHTVMVEYEVDYGERPWAGSQLGRRKAFENGLANIDDDYVYRQEDFVFSSIVKKAGFKEGKISDTFHYHQTMHKPTPWSRKVRSVKIDVEMSREEEVRTWTTQAKGIVKYLDPPLWSEEVVQSVNRLEEMNELSWKEFYRWVKLDYPVWLPTLRDQRFRRRVKSRLKSFLRWVRSLVLSLL